MANIYYEKDAPIDALKGKKGNVLTIEYSGVNSSIKIACKKYANNAVKKQGINVGIKFVTIRSAGGRWSTPCV